MFVILKGGAFILICYQQLFYFIILKYYSSVFINSENCIKIYQKMDLENIVNYVKKNNCEI